MSKQGIDNVRCICGKLLFDGKVLKTRLVIFEDGFAIIRCGKCRRSIVTGKIKINMEDK